jgi:hypothetical protein
MCFIPRRRTRRVRSRTCTKLSSTARRSMSLLCCHGGASAVVQHLGGLHPTASANRTDTASRRLHVPGLSVRLAAEDLAEVEEEVEVAREASETRTGAIVQGAIRPVAALRLGDVEVRAMIAGVPAEARRLEGESVIRVPLEAVLVDGGAARAIQMPVTRAAAVIVAVVGTVADVGDSAAAKVDVMYMSAWRGDSIGYLLISRAAMLSGMYDYISFFPTKLSPAKGYTAYCIN